MLWDRLYRLKNEGVTLVLTSGNVSDEPIAFRDEDARVRLAEIADAFLVHDRPIHTRTDDGVVRVDREERVPDPDEEDRGEHAGDQPHEDGQHVHDRPHRTAESGHGPARMTCTSPAVRSTMRKDTGTESNSR